MNGRDNMRVRDIVWTMCRQLDGPSLVVGTLIVGTLIGTLMVGVLGWPGLAWGEDVGPLPAEVQERYDSLPDAATRADYLRERLEQNPDDASVQFALGNLLLDEGKLEPAVSHLQRVTSLAPGFLGGWVNLGNALDEMGQLKDAEAAYQKALTIDPTDEKTLCNLGGVYFKKREVDKALESFQTAIEHNPKSQLAHYNLAILFADAEIYREAAREWQAAVDIDPQSDLGRRSAENIKIIRQLMSAATPELEGDSSR